MDVHLDKLAPLNPQDYPSAEAQIVAGASGIPLAIAGCCMAALTLPAVGIGYLLGIGGLANMEHEPPSSPGKNDPPA